MALDHARHGKIVLARQIRRLGIGRSADYTPADRRDAHRQICDPIRDLARWIDTRAAPLGEARSSVSVAGDTCCSWLSASLATCSTPTLMALVNAVNTKGVMAKRIALQFKHARIEDALADLPSRVLVHEPQGAPAP
jgi:hypothetical protein